MKFNTRLSGSNTTTIKDKNYTSEHSYDIDWTFYIEARDYGVKSIGIYANKVSITDGLELSEENGWAIDVETDMPSNIFELSFRPEHILVDYDSKLITIQF